MIWPAKQNRPLPLPQARGGLGRGALVFPLPPLPCAAGEGGEVGACLRSGRRSRTTPSLCRRQGEGWGGVLWFSASAPPVRSRRGGNWGLACDLAGEAEPPPPFAAGKGRAGEGALVFPLLSLPCAAGEGGKWWLACDLAGEAETPPPFAAGKGRAGEGCSGFSASAPPLRSRGRGEVGACLRSGRRSRTAPSLCRRQGEGWGGLGRGAPALNPNQAHPGRRRHPPPALTPGP